MVLQTTFFTLLSCFASTIVIIVIGIISVYLSLRHPNSIYQKLNNLTDFMNDIPKEYRHDKRQYLVDMREALKSNRSGEQMRVDFIKESFNKDINRIRQGTKFWNYYWCMYFFFLALSFAFNLFAIGEKYNDLYFFKKMK